MTERFTVDEGLEDVLCWEINDKENENMTCGECAKLLNELHEEKEILEVQLKSATNEIDKLGSEIDMLTDTCHDCCKEIREENQELKSLCKVLIKHIDEKSIAFVIDEDVRRLLE